MIIPTMHLRVVDCANNPSAVIQVIQQWWAYTDIDAPSECLEDMARDPYSYYNEGEWRDLPRVFGKFDGRKAIV